MNYNININIIYMLKYNINLSKWIYSFYIFILFIIISFPLNYKLTNQLFKNIIKISSKDGCPTFYGLLIHTFIFLLLLRFFLQFNTFKEGNTELNDEFTDYDINDPFTSDTVDMSDPSHRHNVNLKPLFDQIYVNKFYILALLILLVILYYLLPYLKEISKKLKQKQKYNTNIVDLKDIKNKDIDIFLDLMMNY